MLQMVSIWVRNETTRYSSKQIREQKLKMVEETPISGNNNNAKLNDGNVS